MLASLTRLITSMRKPVVDRLAPVQPRVTPDPQHAAQLEKRFSELAYEPANGFLIEQFQERVTR